MASDHKAAYYDAGGIETIDILKAKMTTAEYRGWLLGNCIKYSCRVNHKGTAKRDIEKLAFYSDRLNKETSPAGQTEEIACNPNVIAY